MEQRTEEDIISQAPLMVVLGGEQHKVRPLVIKESRVWRKQFTELIGQLPQYANITTDDTEGFSSAMDMLIVQMPDQVVDLFFLYAVELDREQMEGLATDAEIAVGFEEVVKLAFPLVSSLGKAMGIVSQ